MFHPYFKSLPTYCKKLWAVYVIVLEKRRCRPKIYIGSGTEKASGVLRGCNSMTVWSISLDTLMLPYTMSILLPTKDFFAEHLFLKPQQYSQFACSSLLSSQPSRLRFGPCILRPKTTACRNTFVLGNRHPLLRWLLHTCCHSRAGCGREYSRPNCQATRNKERRNEVASFWSEKGCLL